jgi:hypothetical protein
MTENEMTGLLFKLADIGITGVFISYEGSGDSGSLDSITYADDPNVSCIEDLDAIYDNGLDDRLHLNTLDPELHELLESFAYDTLLDNIENWYNDDGGFGYIIIHVKSGEYKIFNTVRYYQTEEYFHTGKLLEKTEE